MEKLEIVKFKNGKYAIRKKCLPFGYLFLDLEKDYWWPELYAQYYAATNDLDKIKHIKESYPRTDLGEVVE